MVLPGEKRHFDAEGLDVTIDQGEGSAATVSRIMSGAYDAGFGDMNAIIQNAATNPDDAPVMVYQILLTTLYVLTKTGGPVKSLQVLKGLRSAHLQALHLRNRFRLRLRQGLTQGVELLLCRKSAGDADPGPSLCQPRVQRDQLSEHHWNGMDPDKDFTWYPYGASGLISTPTE